METRINQHSILADGSAMRLSTFRRGFSLIELLVVVSIIAILASLLLSGMSLVRTAARAAVCATHMRQLAMCVQAYAQDNSGLLPFTQAVVSENGAPTFKTWPIHLLLDYARERSDTLGWGTGQGEDSNAARGIYHCPGSRLIGGAFSDFGMNSHVFPDNSNGWNMAMAWWNPGLRTISNRTYLFADSWNPATAQKSDTVNGTRVNYRHGGAANVLFIDGHIERLRPEQVPAAEFLGSFKAGTNPDKWVGRFRIPWGSEP